MWFVVFLILMIVLTVYMIIEADKESFYAEKNGKIRDLAELLEKGLSKKEVNFAVKKFNGISEPVLSEVDGEKEMYISYFDWKEGPCEYKGEIKFYFENNYLTNREISLV